ncbi:tetratricopeptide repeat protein [Tahibacter harae]|uniref:Tetratricopeptide repeat protein n=1 Tax=Tahibacter harae TaxID=2963937 RepID=A0ABT1QPD2_9GAMM|nr:tetratricopeptide repeat protein [Tahibacter harae]MCQ4164143.1 tetratricopeptide repeat protein [Tahibacter harae]
MKFTRIALACVLALAALAAAADTIRPVPIPDMSKLDKSRAAQLVEMRQQFDKAKTTLVGPPLSQAYATLAANYQQAGFADEADVALANAILVSPEDARWIYLRGLLAGKRNQPAQARDYFEQAFRLDREYLPIRLAVIESRLAAGETDSARQLIDQAGEAGKDDARLAALRARAALLQKRYPEALSAVEAALKQDPTANQLYALQAEIYTAQGNAAAANSARARAGNTAARTLDPLGDGFLGIRSQAPAQAGGAAAKPDDPLTQARFLIEVGQYASAREHLAKVLKSEPGNVGLLGLSARLEAMLGGHATASTQAAEAVRLAPKDALVLVTRGVVAETGGDERAAQSDYEKAIGMDGKLAEPRLLLGNRYMRQGRYAQAAEQYRQLVKLDPRQPDGYARLAAAQVADGRCADALRETEAAAKEYPRMGPLLQVYVRLAATCRAATKEQRKTASEYAGLLYKSNLTPQVSEAVALINAAEGNFTAASELQGSAMFAAVRDGGNEAAEPFRVFFKQFGAKQLPDRPWPADNPLFKPARLQPQPARAAEAPAPKPAG